MPEIAIGVVGAYVGWSLFNTALYIARRQVEELGRIELKLVLAMFFGIVLSAIGGVLIGCGLIMI